MSHSDEALSAAGAARLARLIVAYWRQRGYDHVTAHHYPLDPDGETWFVQSNLINGLPPPKV